MPKIGVAVAIPSPHGETLQEQRAVFGDPLAHAIPPHVTLLPPTEVAVEDVARIEEHLAVACRGVDAFEMVLRGTGTFRPISPVVFVQVSVGLSQCELLERAVRDGVLARSLEFPYHPHVTIAHHLPEEALDRAFTELSDFQVSFPVDEVHLYQHGADEVWRPVQSFALGAG